MWRKENILLLESNLSLTAYAFEQIIPAIISTKVN